MPSSRPFADTKVGVGQSQADLRKVLMRYGASEFAFRETADVAEVAFVHHALGIRIRVPINPPQPNNKASREREERRVWRVLHWLIKARMDAIDAGVETFEQAFLAHVVNPASGQTVYDELVDRGGMETLQITAKASA